MKGTSLNFQIESLLNKHSDVLYLPDYNSFFLEQTSSTSFTLLLQAQCFHSDFEWKINGDDYNEKNYKERMQKWILDYLKKNKINYIQNVKIM